MTEKLICTDYRVCEEVKYIECFFYFPDEDLDRETSFLVADFWLYVLSLGIQSSQPAEVKEGSPLLLESLIFDDLIAWELGLKKAQKLDMLASFLKTYILEKQFLYK